MVSHSHSLLLLAVTTAEGRLGLTRQQLRLRVRRVRARRVLHLLEPFAVPEDPAAAFETALLAVLQMGTSLRRGASPAQGWVKLLLAGCPPCVLGCAGHGPA